MNKKYGKVLLAFIFSVLFYFSMFPVAPGSEEGIESLRIAARATAQAYLNLADIARESGNLPAELDYLEKALSVEFPLGTDDSELEIKIMSALDRIVAIYTEQGKHDEAVRILDGWLEKNSGKLGAFQIQTAVLQRLANLYRKQGKKKEAIEVFRRIVELNTKAKNLLSTGTGAVDIQNSMEK